MLEFIKTFGKDEDGAVTVDWVVLTAAIVGLGIAILATVRTGASDLAGDIGADLTAMDPSS
jgi:Flp pilus assembly pilin Flp